MKNKNGFYIGWQAIAPDEYVKKIRQALGFLFVVVPIVALSLVLSQQGFEDSHFEFGKTTTVRGLLVKYPVPMLKMNEGDGIKSILLVGFGKKGAAVDIATIENTLQQDLEKIPVELNGTLIYHDGKTLLELTEGQWHRQSVNVKRFIPCVIMN